MEKLNKISTFNKIPIDKIIYYADSKEIQITLSPKNTQLNTIAIKEEIINTLPFVKKIQIRQIEKTNSKTLEEIIDSNWSNILQEIKNISPAVFGCLCKTEKFMEDDSVIIKIIDEFFYEELINKKVEKTIEEIIKRNYGIDVNVKFRLEENADAYINEYRKVKENEINKYVDLIINSNSTNQKENDEANNKKEVIIYGKLIKGVEIIKLSSVLEEGSIITVEGEVFELVPKELKSEKILISLSITDFTSSIAAKIFCKKEDYNDLISKIKVGEYYRIRGSVKYDNFEKELVLMVNDINSAKRHVIEDTCDVKRVELHAHTKMSAMDGICSPSDLIKRAADWGHKAIAITDHGVVQAFPEAYDAGKKYGIKIIYGMEGYVINDEMTVFSNMKNNSIDQTFTIFDIETTGLSSKYDKITEIGAVKISKGKIVDTFSALINPGIPIPENITKLTGITNELVSDKPKVNEVLPSFLSFAEGSTLVAHNAMFDISFIRENCKKLNLAFNYSFIDTLLLSRILLPDLKSHKLNMLAKFFKVNLENHHRALDDALATAEIFLKLLEILKEKGIYEFNRINVLFNNDENYKNYETYHINILVKNQIGLKNLYKLVSHSHINTFYKRPRIPKSLLANLREGLIIGTACESGELYKAILNDSPDDILEEIVDFYDFLEIQPLGNNEFLIDKGLVKDFEELKEINKKIVSLGKKYNKPVVATGDVHFLEPNDSIIRKILMAAQGYNDAEKQPPLYFKTTQEMLEDFNYLGEKIAYEVVIENPNRISDSVEEVLPIPLETCPPKIEGAEEDLRNMCYENAKKIYGDPLPDIVRERLEKELTSIIKNGYAVLYIISHKLVAKSLQDGYLVGSRGSVGSSFVATMSNITEVNPLPPHYICPSCKNSEFILDGSIGSGCDLPDKICPRCGEKYKKDGHDIPFEVFLGFEGDKEPDIDLNFAGEYQPIAHKYTEELFGKGKVFRAGTIGTLADKSGFDFAKKYFEERNLEINSRELIRLANACTGIKRTTGQHPGGIMVVPDYKDIHDFTPVQYPANDKDSGVITTHFDYHAISGRLLKLDILGHDVPTIIKMLEELTGIDPRTIPLDDKETLKIFTSTEPLKIEDDELNIDVGTLGIPEFGTKFVRQMLLDTKPTTFAELVRISGLSHGTDVWINNAQDLVREGIVELKDVISTRDDIMNYLIYKGVPPKDAFNIMERVRKGKGLTKENEELLKKHYIPDWYIDSCNKIKYMFPKAHAVAYVMMSFRIAYFKVHFPLAFYCAYFTTKVDDFDAELICKGKEAILSKIKELSSNINNLSQKEKDLYTVLEVAYEAFCRGIKFKKVDLYLSDSDIFKIHENSILPPLRALQGVGESAAKSIAMERKKGEFVSIEDIRVRTKVTKTVIETLLNHGCLKGLPEENQLTLF